MKQLLPRVGWSLILGLVLTALPPYLSLNPVLFLSFCLIMRQEGNASPLLKRLIG
jgi:hypothetical protein